MNLILTSACNKKCPYCFAKENNKIPTQEMSLETVKKVISMVGENGPIKLLGGEPTLYSNFKELLDLLDGKENKVFLLTNMLFSEERLEEILDFIDKGNNLIVLANSTDLLVENRLEKFSYNYNKIYKAGSSLTCGITINENEPCEKIIDYLNKLKGSLININIMRISMRFPGPAEKKNVNDIIGNTKVGDAVLNVVHWCWDNDIEYLIDCCLLPCTFKDFEDMEQIMESSSNDVSISCPAMYAPSDVFPDESVSFCYPTKDLIKLDLNDFKDSDSIERTFCRRYNMVEKIIDKPEKCLKCKYYKHICKGPCLGFYDI